MTSRMRARTTFDESGGVDPPRAISLLHSDVPERHPPLEHRHKSWTIEVVRHTRASCRRALVPTADVSGQHQARRQLQEYNRLVAMLDEETMSNFDDDAASAAKELGRILA